MRKSLLCAAALALAGCGQTTTTFVKSDTTLGRVVVYRNGVAYFERYAEIQGDRLELKVPHDKVDDFLKSLTVVDATTGEPAPISYPSAPSPGGTIDMKVGFGKPGSTHKLRLSYVTEAPSWKPSYRVVVGGSSKVQLQGWAIVDNTSGEDWRDVRLGVGASSAMSFRYDLKGLRLVERETLQENDLFARAPPMGGGAYGRPGGPSRPARVEAAQEGTPPKGAKADDTGGAAFDADGTTEGREPKPASEPIGTSHFESTSAMTVPKGTSAMVSILRAETEGEVVYLFDPESPRGSAQYPFRTLRFRNPTDSALESGPVSVFGEGRFIGEGLAEPIPAHSVAFVPFALDRQIVVETKSDERDDIARIITVNRGVFSTEIRHTKKATFTLFNRMGEKATVYIKHSVTPGYKLTKFPDTRSPAPGAGDASDHLAGANLFRIDLEPNGRADVDIEEATPVFRTTDIRSPAGVELVRAHLSHAAVEGPLKAQVEQLLKLNADMVKIEQQIATGREQMSEYRARMDELHAQLVTLKAVKTAGPLMSHLEKKLQEVSEKMSKGTVEIVALQEKLMVARVQFQSGVADLTLERPDANEAHAAR